MLSLPALLAQAAQEFTEVQLESAPAAWQTFLIVLLVLGFAGASYLLEPRTERSRLRVPLGLLRAALLIAAIVILFRPIRATELREVKDGYVLVVVDTSSSMHSKDREKDEALRESVAQALGVAPGALRDMNRLEQVQRALVRDEGAFIRQLAERNRVRLYGFDATRKRLADLGKLAEGGEDAAAPAGAPGEGEPAGDLHRALGVVRELAPEGPSTALGDALQRVMTDTRSERVAAVVLLSDGRSTGGSISPEAVAARYGRKGVPIYAIGVGDPSAPRDLSVDDLRAPEVSLVGDVVAGSVLVRASGYAEPREVRVRIKLDDRTVVEETGTVGGERPEWQLDWSTKIAQAGEYTIEASVEPDPDELTAENNRVTQPISVIEERIRVLYLEGMPRWEYRFLKNALIRDRQMETQVLLLSADAGYHQEHTDGLTPLSGMPSAEELLRYHVIVLGDVNPEARDRGGAPIFTQERLEAIRTLVKDRGGGLFMISGEQYAPRAFKGTPIADILPVVIDDAGPARREFTREFRPKLTREGYQSRLLRLEDNEEENRRLWDTSLRGLYWYAQVEQAKPQGHVLAYHPTDRNAHGEYPLLVWHRYGAGTAFWSGIDETWRWRAEVGDKYPYKFYGQVIRFLSLQSFTRAKRFFVTTDKTEYAVGEEVLVRAEIRSRPGEAPVGSADATQEVLLDQPSGARQTLVLKGLEGEPGKFEGVFKPVQTGPYKLTIDPKEHGSQEEVASRQFQVKLPELEMQDPRMDQETLERVAQASGGQFLRLDGLGEIPGKIEPLQESRSVGRTQTDLWDQPWVFLLFVGVLIVEWLGRKAARLL